MYSNSYSGVESPIRFEIPKSKRVCFQIETNATLTRAVMEGYVRVPMTLMDLNVRVERDTKEKVVKVRQEKKYILNLCTIFSCMFYPFLNSETFHFQP